MKDFNKQLGIISWIAQHNTFQTFQSSKAFIPFISKILNLNTNTHTCMTVDNK